MILCISTGKCKGTHTYTQVTEAEAPDVLEFGYIRAKATDDRMAMEPTPSVLEGMKLPDQHTVADNQDSDEYDDSGEDIAWHQPYSPFRHETCIHAVICSVMDTFCYTFIVLNPDTHVSLTDSNRG